MDEHEDDALFESIHESEGAAGEIPADQSAPQELAAEHQALLESLSTLRRENPDGEKSLLGHFEALIQAVRAAPVPRGQNEPETPAVARRAAQEWKDHESAPARQASPLEPSQPSGDAPQPPPYAETVVRAAEPPLVASRSETAPDAPTSPEREQTASLDAFIRRRHAAWEAEAYPTGRKPAISQNDMIEDPGWQHPPNMEAHMPQLTNEMGTSLRSVELMFKRMVEMFNEHSRAVNEMQSTLMRNGIF